MKTATLPLTGMISAEAAAAARAVLGAIPGVAGSSVSLLRSEAEIEFDESRVSQKQLQKALADAGFGAPAKAEAIDRGGCCGGCCS